MVYFLSIFLSCHAVLVLVAAIELVIKQTVTGAGRLDVEDACWIKLPAEIEKGGRYKMKRSKCILCRML